MTVRSESGESSEALNRLWQAYRSGGDFRIRDRLVLTLSPIVSFAYAPSTARDEANLSRGFAALVGAIERWDPSRDGALEQFAWGELSRLGTGSLTAA